MAVQQNGDFLLWLRLFDKKSYWQEVSTENDFLKRLAKLLLNLHRTVIYAPLRPRAFYRLERVSLNDGTRELSTRGTPHGGSPPLRFWEN